MSNTLTKSNVIAREGFDFVGNCTRTTNKVEMTADRRIPKLWDDFYKNEVLEAITHKKNSNVLAIYTDYETNEHGAYTFALGAEVRDNNLVPNGMESIQVPDQKYIVFTTRKGPLPGVIIEAWEEIWKWSEQSARAYGADFELYDERAMDPNNSQVDIYICVK
ncbi:GyrI-like domain-containing protein [Cytobacillus sp. Hm23]